jgi:RecB family exonuclease
VLERVVSDAGAPARTSLESARASGPVEVKWPDGAGLDAIALEEARREAASEGIRIEGFARALARWAAAAALRARDEDWRGGEGLRVLGAELSGEAVVEAGGCARRIGFRVDRADEAAGALRLTDYKTGRHPDERKTAEAKRKQLLAALREGRLLQPAAYLHAARPGEAATGRLLYLREDSPEGDRERSVAVGDAEVAAAFAESARVVLAAADAGAWLPRLVEPTGAGEPLACRWCEVATACSRGESGPRRRLHRLALAAAQGCASWPPALRAAAGFLLLGRGGAEP